jgi:hypothetical protein
MSLTANALPFAPPLAIAPKDTLLAFSTGATFQTLTSTNYFGAPTTLDIGPGRFEAYLGLLFTQRKQSAGDESYSVHLLGSNDSAWTDGNVEILMSQNFGALRSIATIPGASPAMPSGYGPLGELNVFPFTNLKSRIAYRYLRAYAVISGTSPSMTCDAWIAPRPTGGAKKDKRGIPEL